MESEIRKKEQALTEKLSKQMQNLVQQFVFLFKSFTKFVHI